eukprot:scaffold559_cov190-Alexandrium_tamarense.AAC.37
MEGLHTMFLHNKQNEELPSSKPTPPKKSRSDFNRESRSHLEPGHHVRVLLNGSTLNRRGHRQSEPAEKKTQTSRQPASRSRIRPRSVPLTSKPSRSRPRWSPSGWLLLSPPLIVILFLVGSLSTSSSTNKWFINVSLLLLLVSTLR